MAQIAVLSCEIPANEALSGAVDIGAMNLVAIEMPEAFSGSTLTFQSKAEVSEHNINNASLIEQDWDNVYDDAGNEVTVTVAANRVVVIGTATKAAIGALRFLRIRSGTSGAPFAQNPTRIIRLICKGT